MGRHRDTPHSMHSEKRGFLRPVFNIPVWNEVEFHKFYTTVKCCDDPKHTRYSRLKIQDSRYQVYSFRGHARDTSWSAYKNKL